MKHKKTNNKIEIIYSRMFYNKIFFKLMVNKCNKIMTKICSELLYNIIKNYKKGFILIFLNFTLYHILLLNMIIYILFNYKAS
jgi:hypothetical protein